MAPTEASKAKAVIPAPTTKVRLRCFYGPQLGENFRSLPLVWAVTFSLHSLRQLRSTTDIAALFHMDQQI